jgi:hypothetical protein
MAASAIAKRVILAVAGITTLATLLIGFAHTKAGRPLLAWLRGAPGCPVQLADVDSAAVEDFRVRQLLLRNGENAARSAAAGRFVLGASGIDEVAGWARSHGSACSPSALGSALSCTELRAPGEPPIRDLFARADAEGRLVALDLMSAPTSSEQALAQLRALETELLAKVGPRTATRGRRDVEGLSAPFSQVSIEYRYQNYVARFSATRLGSRGVVVRQQYQWASAEKLASLPK